jgi:hypothetical protein
MTRFPAISEQIYVAHGAFQPEGLARKCATTPGLVRASKSRGLRLNAQVQKAIEKAIGPKWLFIVRTSTYSGLSIADLAKLLDRGLGRWYASVYTIQSGMAHGGDAHRHAKLYRDGIGPDYFSTDDDVRAAIKDAVAMLLVCMIILQEQIGFGSALEMQLDAFKREFNNVFE